MRIGSVTARERKAGASRRRGAASSTSLKDWIFETVKREIVETRLRPETILVEAGLAARFEVSRPPVREALQRLAALGFVRTVPRVGYIVTNVSLRDLDEIFAMRLVLEPLAVELAIVRVTTTELDHLEGLARQSFEILDERAVADRGVLLARSNSEFHQAVARSSGNGRLENTIGTLVDELERVMYLVAYSPEPVLDSVMGEHLALIEAMRSGDAVVAAQVMRDQLTNDRDVMRELAMRASGVGVIDAASSR